ncbi:type IVB secretion system protein IcmH/DotU [Rhizobium calliandrae]|uniref:Type IVB secretion system protein IcmH/DotU n=1 Tax=Rhizobium calliandrae TaxID=1312182 RepID=A0ABT7KJR9_9HYPH|nr:type IVB secretion system protein IcmH/DotU [Rhizobium calliandrae]MDL2408861.1 type IVB secretion system protein IcmH/DotU [Rhizobium calliandrae]
MSNFGDDSAPRVVHQVSPRTRTALGADRGEDPTVVVRQSLPSPAPVGDASSLRNAIRLVQQLDTAPERKLVRLAAPLLLIVAQLRNSTEQAGVAALRREVVQEMDRFQQIAQKSGIEAGDIVVARYVLCAMIDETVLMTPWGSRSEWTSNSLLNQYHNETWGGEKVFVILDRVKQLRSQRLPLLLLIHACLMLGFEGRYRIVERGRDQLEDLRNDLSHVIAEVADSGLDEPLSKVSNGERGGKRIRVAFPLWMIVAIAGLSLVVVYSCLEFYLSGALSPLLARIAAITPE